ncbi:MAG: cytochrome c oxidase assembly protein [Dermatophilaceae bacterium]
MSAPLTPGTLLTSWVFDPLGAALAVTLTCLYAVCLVRARRRGARWHWLRSVTFFILGTGSLVYATCGALAAYRTSLFWVAAIQAAVLSAVTPMGLALGDPITLAEKALGDKGVGQVRRVLTGSAARVLMFPLVSSLLAVGSLIAVFFTGYFTSSASSALVRDVLAVAEVVGLPLLAAVFVSWVRADDADARQVDAVLGGRCFSSRSGVGLFGAGCWS